MDEPSNVLDVAQVLRSTIDRPEHALHGLMEAVDAGQTKAAASCLRQLPAAIAKLLPSEWIEKNATALERGDYDPLSPLFANSKFVGPDGHFLIVAPWVFRKSRGDVCALAALFGQVIPHHPTPGIAEAVEDMQGAKLRAPVTPVYPIRILSSAGTVKDGWFIVPDAWMWRDSVLGPAFSNISKKSQVLEESGAPAMRRMFDADTAEFLIDLLHGERGVAVTFRSYEIHDAGHASGLGLPRKIHDNLIPGYWYKGVEEWRADGIGFELGSRLFTVEEAAADIAANFYARFGLAGITDGTDGPTEHTPCALLMLDRLLREGHLVAKGERLALRDPTIRGLVRAMEPQRHEVLELTRRELDLVDATSVMRLYGSMSLHPATLVVYESMMRAPTVRYFRPELVS